MARGEYHTSPEHAQLRTALAWAQSSHRQPAAAGVVDLMPLSERAIRALRALSGEKTEALRAEARALLRGLAGEEGVSISTPFRPVLRVLRIGGRASLQVDGAPRDVVLYQIGRLAELVGLDRLRACPAPDCGKVFVRRGRAEYCSARCRRRVFLAGYDPFRAKPRRTTETGERHGKATR